MIRLARRVICCMMIVSFVRCISVVDGRKNVAEEKNLFHGMQTELTACWGLHVASPYMHETLSKLRNAVHQTMELADVDMEEMCQYVRAIYNYVATR